MKTMKFLQNLFSRSTEGFENPMVNSLIQLINSPKLEKTNAVAIFRLDEQAPWEKSFMSCTLIKEKDWVMIDVALSKKFSMELLQLHLTKKIRDKCEKWDKTNLTILVNYDSPTLQNGLKKFGIPFQFTHSVLPEEVRKDYPLMKVGEPGFPEPHSAKNMSLDVAWFYRAFNK